MTHRFSVVILLALTSPALADDTPQPLPFRQDWSDTDLITTNNNWDNVPGIIGYLGRDSSTSTGGIDPRTVLAPSSEANDISVVANQTATTSTTGAVAEFHLANPVVGFLGSGTADAPNLVITVNTTGVAGVRIKYNVRDIDDTGDEATQAVALQYRVGTTGNFVNVPEGYIADATESSATKVTPVDVVLPADVGNQPVVQIRIITGNAQGNDEWIGIDDIEILDASTPPTAVGTANPASAQRGDSVTLTAEVTPGTDPASTNLSVTCDLSSIGGSAAQPLFDDGTNGDAAAGDNEWTFATTVGTTNVAAGAKMFPCTVEDAEGRSSTFDIAFEVASVCGDGIVEGTETCDDAGTTAGDGCSATCTVESGYACTGMPSVCTDIDECADDTDNCDENATCTNTPGSFTCECKAGWEGNGTTCTDIDECTEGTDNCDSLAACTNTPGSFTCECPSGYDGDGTTDGTGCTDIDECADETDDCVAGASCTNTDGAFTCACPDGFTGDGHSGGSGCTDTDECATMADTCDENASCTNTSGGFTCECNDGYTGDGMTCADIDECAMGLDNCAANATCTNTPGSFTCACPPGYTGDGVTCKAPGTPDDEEDDGGCCSSSTHPGGAALLALVVIAGLRRRQRR